MWTFEHYELLERNIALAKTQLISDGKPCAICGDNDHQAFECRFNPLVIARNYEDLEKALNETANNESNKEYDLMDRYISERIETDKVLVGVLKDIKKELSIMTGEIMIIAGGC